MRVASLRSPFVFPLLLTVVVLATLTVADSVVHVQSASCGNGVIELGETCDDGNQIGGDGCSPTCQVEEQCYDPGNAFSFFLWSDSYTSSGADGVARIFADAVDRLKYAGRIIPRFWFATGDIPFMSDSDHALDDLNDGISNSASGSNYPFQCSASNGKFPYFVAIGNHDVDGYGNLTPQIQYDYWRNVVGPRLGTTLVGITNFKQGPNNGYDANTTYSFDYKNAHFVVINQYHDDPTYPTTDPVACIRPSLYQWVDQDLTETTQPIKFVFGHEPAWSYCSNLSGFGGDFCLDTNIDNQTPASRMRPYSSTGDWLQPFGEHWGDSLEDGRCPDGSREAFWNMVANHNVIAHFVGPRNFPDGSFKGALPSATTSAYSKTGQTFGTGEGVWEVNTGQAHNTAGTLYVLVTVKDDLVTFETYDQITYATNEPFKLVESWNVSLSGNFNRPPALAAIPNQTTSALQTLTFIASATDPDAGQTITYSLVGAPDGASIDPANGVFSCAPASGHAFAFWVKATDDGAPRHSAAACGGHRHASAAGSRRTTSVHRSQDGPARRHSVGLRYRQKSGIERQRIRRRIPAGGRHHVRWQRRHRVHGDAIDQVARRIGVQHGFDDTHRAVEHAGRQLSCLRRRRSCERHCRSLREQQQPLHGLDAGCRTSRSGADPDAARPGVDPCERRRDAAGYRRENTGQVSALSFKIEYALGYQTTAMPTMLPT